MALTPLKATGSPQDLDEEEIRRALKVLTDPDLAVELRFLPSGRSVTGLGREADALLAAIRGNADARGIYYALNPVRAGLTGAARVADVLCRRWFLIDIDPVKPANHKDDSATDPEKHCAGLVAGDVRRTLAGYGWPEPVLVDSGNGWHVLYRVDLPNDELARTLLKGLLYQLAARHDLQSAKIDRSVHNASRIAKLPGTMARKGPDSAERPHRLCRLVFVPEPLVVVPTPTLQATLLALAGSAPAGLASPVPPTTPPPAPRADRGLHVLIATSGSAEAAYVRAALRSEVAHVAAAAAGDRNNTLNRAAFALGTLYHLGQADRADIEAQLYEAACQAGLDQDEGCGPPGIRATIKSGFEAGLACPRLFPEGFATHLSGSNGKTIARARIDPDQPVIYRASTVQPRKVEWLWPHRVPLAKLTTFAGHGGLGKTFTLVDMAARISRGDEWPDSQGVCAEVGQILLISGEDDPEDTLVPRLIEARADLDRVCFLKTEVLNTFTLADLDTLDAAAAQIGADLRLVAIDPPTAYLGGANDHKNAELRALLTPLQAWAARQRCAVIFNTHMNKGGGKTKVEAMMRVMGSVAWVNAVRAAYLFTPDPEDRDRIFFLPLKNNLGPRQNGLVYQIEEQASGEALIRWQGEIDMSADEALERRGKTPRAVKASAWLEEYFGDKEEVPSNMEAATAAGLSHNAVREARAEMGITARQKPTPEGGHGWVWNWSPAARRRWQAKKAGGTDEESC
jgi:hypothetical protein